jgi:hypothetical protein
MVEGGLYSGRVGVRRDHGGCGTVRDQGGAGIVRDHGTRYHCGEDLQEVEITLENNGFLELRRP